jgi:hypothetical protein
MATEWSDVDVYVVRSDEVSSTDVRRSPAIDEIPVLLPDLEQPPAFGTDGW